MSDESSAPVATESTAPTTVVDPPASVVEAPITVDESPDRGEILPIRRIRNIAAPPAPLTPQEALDGSPRSVVVTLADVHATGTFRDQPPALELPPHQPVIAVTWPCGPVAEVGINGCAIEDVLDVCIARLEGFQRGPLAGTENGQALQHLAMARRYLQRRTQVRQAQGVEGTPRPHVS